MVTKNSDKLIETNSDKRVSQSVSQSTLRLIDEKVSLASAKNPKDDCDAIAEEASA